MLVLQLNCSVIHCDCWFLILMVIHYLSVILMIDEWLGSSWELDCFSSCDKNHFHQFWKLTDNTVLWYVYVKLNQVYLQTLKILPGIISSQLSELYSSNTPFLLTSSGFTRYQIFLALGICKHIFTDVGCFFRLLITFACIGWKESFTNGLRRSAKNTSL